MAPTYKVIGGNKMPAGVDVGVSTYALRHNPDTYPEPFEIRPERRIASDKNSKFDVDAAKSNVAGLSTGPRSCVGMPLAYLEMMITTARALFQFYLELA